MLRTSNTFTNRLLALAFCATAFGCAAGTDASGEVADDSASTADPLAALVAPIDQQASTPNPEKPYFVSVTANGTGCPAGTWIPEVDPAGEYISVSFTGYEANIDNPARMSVKDCLLRVKLKSPNGLSYAISDFEYEGYAFMDKGIKGFQSAKYYFQGLPIPKEEIRTDLVGPYDASYTFRDKVRTADMVWSPCGKERDLSIVTRLQVQRLNGTGSGYMNLTVVEGRIDGKIVLKLDWRKCA